MLDIIWINWIDFKYCYVNNNDKLKLNVNMYISVFVVFIIRNYYKMIKILCGLIKINKIIFILVDDLNILKYGV